MFSPYIIKCNFTPVEFSSFFSESDPIRSVTEQICDDFPDVFESLSDVEGHLDQDHVQAVGWTFGRPCYNPGSFQVS